MKSTNWGGVMWGGWDIPKDIFSLVRIWLV